jgi:hypothetical protein
MRSNRSWMVVLGLATLLSPFFGCSSKSCDEWYKDVVNQCCAGKTSCSLTVDQTSFDNMCKPIDDKCGTSLTCSGTPSGSTCTVECSCG